MFGKTMTTIAMMTAALSLAACTAETSGDDVWNVQKEPHGIDDGGGGGKVCPMLAFRCDVGYRLADTNGDGCDDGCERVACAESLLDCAEGTGPADTDGDGCLDSCEPIACPAVMFDCAPGAGPADSNGDGCVDSCRPVVPPQE